MQMPAVRTVDYHTGGEPFRIVDDPPVDIPGASVADRRARAIGDTEVDRLRRLLCFEPRGHADMYGGFITAPDDDGADFGVLFWHKDGFSTACGHGSIALGVWAIETGRVARDPSGITAVTIDVPSGRVTAYVHTDGAQVTHVEFVNVPSYAIARDVPVTTDRGPASVDIAYGGANFAHLRASDVGLSVTPDHVTELIAIGRQVKWLLDDSPYAVHPSDPRLSGIYGTVIFDDLAGAAEGAGSDDVHQRNVAIFADGEVDRSPCGSGSSSRVAMLVDRGVLRPGGRLIHDSIVGSRFVCSVESAATVDGRAAVVPRMTGTAYRVGACEFSVDPRDPLVPGFVLR